MRSKISYFLRFPKLAYWFAYAFGCIRVDPVQIDKIVEASCLQQWWISNSIYVLDAILKNSKIAPSSIVRLIGYLLYTQRSNRFEKKSVAMHQPIIFFNIDTQGLRKTKTENSLMREVKVTS